MGRADDVHLAVACQGEDVLPCIDADDLEGKAQAFFNEVHVVGHQSDVVTGLIEKFQGLPVRGGGQTNLSAVGIEPGTLFWREGVFFGGCDNRRED